MSALHSYLIAYSYEETLTTTENTHNNLMFFTVCLWCSVVSKALNFFTLSCNSVMFVNLA